MNIVFLDRKSLGDDLDLSRFETLGTVTAYGFTAPEEVPARIHDADIVIVNKTRIDEPAVRDAAHLRAVLVTATGVNNLDIPYLESRGIHWHNVKGYSTESVAQHTLAMALYMYEHLPYYDSYVKTGKYASDVLFTHFAMTFHELAGKTWGIAGLGTIGRRVAALAEAFGMHVIWYSTSGIRRTEKYEEKGWEDFLRESDILSVHAPLNERTEGLFDAEAFQKMKDSAYFINVGRGPIVKEADLAAALDNGVIAGAALDVLSEEPMAKDSPFLQMQHPERILITPHIAWASIEARERLIDIIFGQAKEEAAKIQKA